MQATIDIQEIILIKFATKTQSSEKGISFCFNNIIYFFNFNITPLKVFRPLRSKVKKKKH